LLNVLQKSMFFYQECIILTTLKHTLFMYLSNVIFGDRVKQVINIHLEISDRMTIDPEQKSSFSHKIRYQDKFEKL